MAYQAEQLKAKGNQCFKEGDYEGAIALYSQAIQKNPNNPLLYTNRANARLKLQMWHEVIDDCLRSLELMPENMKAFFYLAQAQLSINHPHEALSSAITAYDLCVASPSQTSSAFTVSALVLRCKRAKWEVRERERRRRRSALLAELEDKLEAERRGEVEEIERRERAGEMGAVEAAEERAALEEAAGMKEGELRSVFALADPEGLAPREVPDYLVDDISFELMHDPVITKNGQSYERATIIEHLKRSPTDPLTREPLTIDELRPNIALKKACDEFLENNRGWVYDW